MNKKSLISMLVSLCLVGVIGLGATFAYLSTTTGTLTNTFTVGNVNGTLLEEVPDGADADSANDVVIAGTPESLTGYAYLNLLPAQKIVKAPYIEIAPEVVGTPKSADAIAYIKVTGLDALVALTDGALPIAHPAFTLENFPGTGWEKVSGTGTGLDAIYRYTTTLVVGTVNNKTGKIFTGITFNSNVEGTTLGTAVGNIVLKGCLVQAEGNSTPDVVATAKLQ